MILLSEKLSMKSSSRKSASSVKSSVIAIKKAEAEVAKVKSEFAEKHAALLVDKAILEEKQVIEEAVQNRKRTVLETEINVLKSKEQAAIAAAEAEALDNFTESISCKEEFGGLANLPKEDPNERVATFVNSVQQQDGTNILGQPLDPQAPEFLPKASQPLTQMNLNQTSVSENCVPTDIARFLLKKDLLMSRLTNFNDKPESYHAWKLSFRNVVGDLRATPDEETDMLIKYLGPDSKRHAINLRSVNVSNPARGLLKIWERLDERYGAPELVKHAIVSKLKLFSVINSKDPKKLYELVDILSEVDALKKDSKYALQLSYFDSSEGILPIVQKLPYNIQEKWVTKAAYFKKNNSDRFPPFSYFLEFISDIAKIRNDPGLVSNVPFEKNMPTPKSISTTCKKTEIVKEAAGKSDLGIRCPIHKASHSLLDCRSFKAMSVSERKKVVKDSRLCFKCLETNTHRASNCRKEVKCTVCGSIKHQSLMHELRQNDISLISVAQVHDREKQTVPSEVMSSGNHGGEQRANGPDQVKSKCTQICGSSTDSMGGRSCAKIVLVDVYNHADPSHRLRTYAVIDEQSNRSLASPNLISKLGLPNEPTEFTLNTCSGPTIVSGRKAFSCVVESIDGSSQYFLPPLLECTQIPNAREEIPTPDIATYYSHLHSISSLIPALDDNAEILLLIGRDLAAVHRVCDQIVGPDDTPFAQKLGLGWVIIGQVCLGQIHLDNVVNCNKTYLLQNGRSSVFSPCTNNFSIKEHSQSLSLGEGVFSKTKDDDKIGLSVEDREFLNIMENGMRKDPCGNWVAPLPFRPCKPNLPNNRSYALKRASLLHTSLLKNPTKRDHFVSFMEQIFKMGHVEVAPPLPESKECWYLPLFGVYHPKKQDQIRGVFDASAKFQNISLNDVLLQGPDLTNNLVGILLRFRKDMVAISADIEKMFYSFLVEEKDRDYLRFFWYAENDPMKELVEYRMRVHVFGNKPSPSVANFGLQKTASISESEYGSDVKRFISSDFYVDDGLTSTSTAEQSVNLMKRTQAALYQNGHLRLHKIASNSQAVLKAFPQEDLAKDLASLDLSKDYLPIQRSLGLSWNLKVDCFSFAVPELDKPYTRRGVLSVLNSLYDPMGFVAPVTIVGKVLLRSMTTENCNWDEPLPERFLSEWKDWTGSLKCLQQFLVPRTYCSHSLSQSSYRELLLFCDASEKAIASVAYLLSYGPNLSGELGFVMGKAKVAPTRGHTIPRLELCAAVLAVEIADFVLEQLDIKVHKVRYFTDSKVVLGYVYNRTRRFYTYVSNRVDRILSSSESIQWCYVNTKDNPADAGTRGVPPDDMVDNIWLKGPPECVYGGTQVEENYPLQNPSEDKEVRPEVVSMMTYSTEVNNSSLSSRFQRFSTLTSLTRAISNLQHICRSFNGSCECTGWHLCQESSEKGSRSTAQNLIVKTFQFEWYPSEMLALTRGKPVSSNSTLLSLNPFLDDDGILRVGGRLKHSTLPSLGRNPIIVPSKSHLATLLIRHFHEKVLHQGRHFTEGAVREGGFWIPGGKRKISSYIFSCVPCRRLRGARQSQIMADLPADRLTPAPPFSYVGVDVFGPWSIVTRKTRGGQSSNKRWAVLFTCLTIRAVHIELVEEMSSSAFINALRRFVAIRGNVLELRSDRGTNFVGATSDLGVDLVNIEDGSIKKLLNEKGISWIFNPPHASHMGGVWERMIGVVRKILDSLLTSSKLRTLTHDVLATFMAEVCAIVNGRPIVPVSSDSEFPEILSPSMLLTQKVDPPSSFNQNLSLKDIYREEWKRVQILADQFWNRWQSEFLSTLQTRQKWQAVQPDLKKGDVVLMKDDAVARNQWPVGLVDESFSGSDSKVRCVKVKVIRDGKPSYFTRPITELVLLISN